MMKGPNRSDLFLTILLFTSVGRNLSLSSGENISVDGIALHFRMYIFYSAIRYSDYGWGGGEGITERKLKKPLYSTGTQVSVLVFTNEVVTNTIYTVPKIIDFPRYNKKNVARKTLYYFGIFRVVSRFPLHSVLYLGNVDYF